MDNGTDGCNFLRLLGLRKKKTPPSVEEEQPLEQESSVDQNESTKGKAIIRCDTPCRYLTSILLLAVLLPLSMLSAGIYLKTRE